MTLSHKRLCAALITALFLFAGAFAVLPHAASAAEGGGTIVNGAEGGGTVTPAGSGLTNPLKFSTLPDLLNALLDFMITLGGIAIVIMLVFIGFKFVAAQGNSEKLVEARTMLLWTVIGALVLLGAKAIELGIQATVASLSS